MTCRNVVPHILAALCLGALPQAARAQRASDSSMAHRLLATREELTARLAPLRGLVPKADKPGPLMSEMLDVERRLAEGDFHAGDRILVKVEDPLPVAVTPDRPVPVGKSQEQQLSDTFTVGETQDVVLPGLGRVSLRGLLRSEVAPFLTAEISRSIRDPVVQVTPLVSVGVTGEVARPGFYAVTPDAIVSGVLTAAGGPTKDARLGKLKIERAGRPIWEGNRLRNAVQLGLTLDQLRIEPGDVVDVPPKHTLDNLYRPLQFLALIGSIVVATYAVASHIAL